MSDQASKQKQFYHHLWMFLAVNVVLFIINLVFSPNWWFYWITLIWGLVVLYKAIMIFGPAWTNKRFAQGNDSGSSCQMKSDSQHRGCGHGDHDHKH